MTLGPYQLAWYGVDLKTGGIVEDLPSLKPTGALLRKLGDSAAVQFELALPGAPAGWEGATAPGRSMLVAVDTATDTPVWAGCVLPRTGGSSQTVQLGAATLEAYLNARYPGTQTLIATDQASVIAALATPALTGGPPIVIDSIATGTTMTYLADDNEDKSILSCLKEIMALDGGPEWTIDVAWNAQHNGFQFPLRIRSAIGTQSATPEATFDFPGCVDAYTLVESYESEKGATSVIARGEGEGSSRLTSSPHLATALIAAGWPTWEYRYTPAAGITDPDQLEAHAASSVALMAQGAQVWSVTATASRSPRLGTDWGIGDSVHLAVEPGGKAPRHPNGTDVIARCWSWQLDVDNDQVSPILVEEDS